MGDHPKRRNKGLIDEMRAAHGLPKSCVDQHGDGADKARGQTRHDRHLAGCWKRKARALPWTCQRPKAFGNQDFSCGVNRHQMTPDLIHRPVISSENIWISKASPLTGSKGGALALPIFAPCFAMHSPTPYWLDARSRSAAKACWRTESQTLAWIAVKAAV